MKRNVLNIVSKYKSLTVTSLMFTLFLIVAQQVNAAVLTDGNIFDKVGNMYKLKKDLNGDPIIITLNDVTLDLQNHSVTCNGLDWCIYVGSKKKVNIVNGKKISGADVGIYVDFCDSATVQNIDAVYGDLYGILMAWCTNSYIYDCIAKGTSLDGISLYRCENTKATSSYGVSSKRSGIMVYGGGTQDNIKEHGNKLEYCGGFYNTDYGICQYTCQYLNLYRCDASSNSTTGFEVLGGITKFEGCNATYNTGYAGYNICGGWNEDVYGTYSSNNSSSNRYNWVNWHWDGADW